MNLVLASTSRYRKALLERIQHDFITVAPRVNETRHENEPPLDYVKRLSIEKSQAPARDFPNALIIGSDQILVTHDGQIQGKPGTHENAINQLKHVRGNQAKLITGIALFNAQSGNQQYDCVEYRIGYRDYSDQEIDQYLQREKPYDCAGALKSEGLGTVLLNKLSGDDPTAVIGLPLIRLTQMLLDENIRVL